MQAVGVDFLTLNATYQYLYQNYSSPCSTNNVEYHGDIHTIQSFMFTDYKNEINDLSDSVANQIMTVRTISQILRIVKLLQ